MASSTERIPPADVTPPSSQNQSGPARPPSRRRAKEPAAEAYRDRGPPDIVLVGAGPAARESVLPAVLALQQAGALHVRAIVEADETAREQCRRDFPAAVGHASFEAVVAPPDTLAIITSPVRFHAAQASAAFKRGWHALCANPFAPTARDGALMIAAAGRHERILAVDLARRFYPAARYLRTLCRDHLLGPPIRFSLHEGAPRPIPDDAAPGAEKFEAPDGVLQELGVPALDLLTWCLGSASVKGYADDAMGGVEANAQLELSFAEGVHGTVHLSRDWPTEQSWTFIFERGIIRWDTTHPGRFWLQIASAPGALCGELGPPLSAHHPQAPAAALAPAGEAAVAQLQHILTAIARRETPRVAAPEAMHSLSIIEECYARRTPLPQPWLPPNEAVQARALSPPMALRRP